MKRSVTVSKRTSPNPGLSVYSGKIGQQIASPLITVVDDATLPGRRGSFRVDDEGTKAQRTVLVEQGILKTYLYDRLTAMKDGTRSTGNGRRESYRHRPIPRMTNTMIVPGATKPADILKVHAERPLRPQDGRRSGEYGQW